MIYPKMCTFFDSCCSANRSASKAAATAATAAAASAAAAASSELSIGSGLNSRSASSMPPHQCVVSTQSEHNQRVQHPADGLYRPNHVTCCWAFVMDSGVCVNARVLYTYPIPAVMAHNPKPQNPCNVASYLSLLNERLSGAY